MWYFSGQGSDDAVATGKVSASLAYKWSWTFQLGTICYGSFLLAVMDFIRTMLESFVNSKNPNPVLRCLVSCILYIFDRFLKFINKQAFIHAAFSSTDFCTSAKTGFFLAIRNFGRFVALELAAFIIMLLGKGIIIALSLVLCYFIGSALEVGNLWAFLLISVVFGSIICNLFL